MQMNTLEAWRDYRGDEDLIGLSKNLRSPGGTIADAAGNQIRHPGFQVSVLTLSNLKVMRLALQYHENVQRTITPLWITQEFITDWEFLVEFRKETEKRVPKDDELPKVDMKDWAKTKERIIDHFSGVYGKTGIPLAYILRDESDVPDEFEDDQENYNGDHIKELIARAPHQGAAYKADNRTMLRLLKKMFEDTAAFDYVRRYTENGRKAWIHLQDVYLGPQHTQNMAGIHEHRLQNATYEGESSRFGFDKYTEIHVGAYTVLKGLEKHGYSVPDEGTRIRYFLNGIKTDKLKSIIELVRNNKDYTTFDSVVRRLKDSVIISRPTKDVRRVSAVSLKDRRGKELFPGVQPDMSPDDRYYDPDEWKRLPAAKKKGILLKRKQRTSNKQQKQTEKSKVKKQAREIKALRRKLASVTVSQPEDEEDSGSSDDEAEQPKKKKKKTTTNRDHPATSRR